MTDGSAGRARLARARRLRWRIVLLAGAGLLVLYYGLVIGSMTLHDTSAVALDDSGLSPGSNRITLEVEAVNLDTSTGAFDVQVLPVPRGALAGERRGELRDPLEVELTSPGQLPQSFDFPADQLVDPVGASMATTVGAQSYPFDKPRVVFRMEASSRDRRVPVAVEMVDRTDGWNLSGAVDEDDNVLRVDLAARREMLPISFTLFYVAGIVVVALITIVVIGGSIVRRQVGFDQIIWLGAMLVAIPAVRNEMPGVPPIGTAVDMFVFLPSVALVGAALLASIVVLAINEAAASRAVGEGE
jgi:hypothetical protein